MPRRLTEGLPDPQIAEWPYLSPYTAKAHPDSIYGESGVASRSAATRVALEHHLA